MASKMTQRLKFSATLLSTAVLVTGCASGPGAMGSLQPVYRVQGQQLALGVHSFYEQGKQHFVSQHYGLALQAFQSELVRNPNSVQVLNGIAACYDKMQRYDLAANYYYQTLAIEPDSVRTLSNLGYSFILQGRNADAKKVLSLALMKDPANAIARSHLALASDHPSDLSGTLVTHATLPEKIKIEEVRVSVERETVINKPIKKAEEIATSSQVVVAEEPLPTVTAMVEPVVEESLPTVATVDEIIVEYPLSSTVTIEKFSAGSALSDVVVTDVVADISVTDSGKEVIKNSELMPVGITITATIDTDQGGLSPSAIVATVPSLLKDNDDVNQAASYDKSKTLQVADEHMVSKPAERATLVKNATYITEAGSVRAMYAVHKIPTQDVALRDSQSGNGAMTIEWKEDLAAQKIVRQEADATARIELSNGNGREGVARLLQNILSSKGIVTKSVTNADHYDYKETVIYYASGRLAAAKKLSNSLPKQARLEETSNNRKDIDITLLIGEDFPGYGNVSKARVEVSNGNGLNGLASLMQNVLRQYGESVNLITNADHFNYDDTVVYYSTGKLKAAEQLMQRLPVKAILRETRDNRNDIDVKVVLGKDFLIHEFAMRKKMETNA
ncbi:LytR C-terminal domain-containing protein [Sulfuriflexus sp.]|uniref:LytR C-terminal domain-containing protein n=1 Tax=Sulfuriflexus sp. TaxID=2015443 RepID=UPI0028CE63DA|nr:LytR C-terminal domain-containing protein [Sulfuriflexus sp.]MDT8403031.1 LytR C-terminal domain-containing protein [Sulfuriflexus sp.]